MRVLKLTLNLNLLLAALFTAITTGSLLARPNDWAAIPLACFTFIWGMIWIVCASVSRDQARVLVEENKSLTDAAGNLMAQALTANKELFQLRKERDQYQSLDPYDRNEAILFKTPGANTTFSSKPPQGPNWTHDIVGGELVLHYWVDNFPVSKDAYDWAIWVQGRNAALSFEGVIREVKDNLKKI